MRRKSKKSMKATRDSNSAIESKNKDQEKISNMCFMAIDDEVKSLELNNDEFNDEFDHLSYEELLNDFNNLHWNMKNSFLRMVLLKRKFLICQKSLKIFQKKRKVILLVTHVIL